MNCFKTWCESPRLLLYLLSVLCIAPLHAQTLKIATIAPEGSTWMKDMRAGAVEIRQRTSERVKVKFYGGGVQGNDKQVQRKMRTGQLHGGAFTSGSMNNFQKEADLYALALMFNNLQEVQFVRSQFDSELRQRLEDAGYVNFGFASGGFAYMMSNQPVRTLKDMKGRKIWTPEGDALSYAALRALGVAPVSMPLTDVMTGLQTELLDSVTVPPVGAVVLQWHTRLKYITELPVAYVYAALLIDKKVFLRLQPEDQAVVREVMENIYQQFDENALADNENALQALRDSGLEIVSADEGEVISWREIVNRSHREQAHTGALDMVLLEQLQNSLNTYRANAAEN